MLRLIVKKGFNKLIAFESHSPELLKWIVNAIKKNDFYVEDCGNAKNYSPKEIETQFKNLRNFEKVLHQVDDSDS